MASTIANTQQFADAVDYAHELSVLNTVTDISKVVNNSRIRPTQSAQLFNNSQGTYGVGTRTMLQVLMVPSAYEAVQLTFFHVGGGGPLTGMEMVIAATDDLGDLLNDQNSQESRKFTVPWRNGVRHNTLSDDGWKKVTWNGSETLDLPDTGTDQQSFAKSDIIELSSRAVIGANASRFAGYRPIIVRAYMGTGSHSRGGQAGNTSANFINESGPHIILGGAAGVNAVADLTRMADTAALSINDSNTLPVIVEAFKTDPSTRSLMMIGDSRFASGSTEDTRPYRNTGWFVQQAAHADGQKLSLVQMVHGGKGVEVYQGRAMSYLKTGGYVDTAVYLVNSINNGTPSTKNIASSKAKTLIFLDQCAKNGISPVLVTAFPLPAGYNADQILLLDDLRSFVQSLNVPYIDPLTEYGDATYTWQAGFGTGDSHMTDTGYQDLGSKLYALVKGTWR